MREIVKTTLFKKDYKRIKKRRFPESVFVEVLLQLAADSSLPSRCRPHKLSGEYAGLWECHISPDWLLIYEYQEGELILRRTGTHSDLFK